MTNISKIDIAIEMLEQANASILPKERWDNVNFEDEESKQFIVDIMHEYIDDLFTFDKVFNRIMVEGCSSIYLLNILKKARDLKQPKMPC